MQMIEVAGVLAFIALGAVLLWTPMLRLREDRPAAFQAVLGLGLGLVCSGIVLIFTTDLFPDRLQPVSRVILLIALAAEVTVVGIKADL